MLYTRGPAGVGGHGKDSAGTMSDHRPMDFESHPLLGQWDFGQELPVVTTKLPPAAALERLDALALRGKLPGFVRDHGNNGFRVEVFAEPFDRVMIGRAEPAPDGSTLLRLRLRTSWKMPLLFLVVTLLTIWPGVWLMDSMLRTYFPGYSMTTWLWYIPVTVLPLPWVVRGVVRKSQRLGHESAKEQIARITEAVSGTLVTGEPPRA